MGGTDMTHSSYAHLDSVGLLQKPPNLAASNADEQVRPTVHPVQPEEGQASRVESVAAAYWSGVAESLTPKAWSTLSMVS